MLMCYMIPSHIVFLDPLEFLQHYTQNVTLDLNKNYLIWDRKRLLYTFLQTIYVIFTNTSLFISQTFFHYHETLALNTNGIWLTAFVWSDRVTALYFTAGETRVTL